MINKAKVLLLTGILIIVIAGINTLSYAAVIGGPSSPDLPKGRGVFDMKKDSNLSIKAGGDLDFIFDRKLKPDVATDFKLTSAQWHMARFSVSFLNDRIEPYIRVGVAHFKTKWTEPGGEQIKLDSDMNFAWGVGARAMIYKMDKPNIKFIGDVQYRMANPGVSKAFVGADSPTPNQSHSEFTIREWQFALLAATDIDVGNAGGEDVLGVSKLSPYGGIKYSNMNGRVRLTQDSGIFYNPGAFSAENRVGIVAGCDIMGSESVLVNIEGRLLDENAISGGIEVLF